MPYCVACSNRCWKKNTKQIEQEKKENITFHRFPKDMTKRNIWLQQLGLTNWNPPNGSAVCSKHFKKESFDYSSESKIRLKENAIPYLETNSMEQFGHGCKDRLSLSESKNDINLAIEHNYCKTVCKMVQNISGASHSIDIIMKVPQQHTAGNIVHASQAKLITSTVKECHDKSTCVSPERIFNSPTKQFMREVHASEMKEMRRKLGVANNSLRRCRDRIKTLSCLLKDVKKIKTLLKNLKKKNLLSREELDIINTFDK